MSKKKEKRGGKLSKESQKDEKPKVKCQLLLPRTPVAVIQHQNWKAEQFMTYIEFWFSYMARQLPQTARLALKSVFGNLSEDEMV